MEENKTAGATPAIYRAIAGVISDVGSVAKDKVNKQQGFKYRSVDDVFNALHPALAKNKVFIVPTTLERKEQVIGKTKNGADMLKVVCKIKFEFYAEDGSSVVAIIYGEGLDTGDKATNKAMAIAYKYACFQVFCIPTEDMIDPDSERPEEELEKSDKKTGNVSAKPNSKSAGGGRGKETGKAPEPEGKDEVITEPMLNTIREKQKAKGVTDAQILGRCKSKAKKIEDMTVSDYKHIMDIFSVTPDINRGQQDEQC